MFKVSQANLALFFVYEQEEENVLKNILKVWIPTDCFVLMFFSKRQFNSNNPLINSIKELALSSKQISFTIYDHQSLLLKIFIDQVLEYKKILPITVKILLGFTSSLNYFDRAFDDLHDAKSSQVVNKCTKVQKPSLWGDDFGLFLAVNSIIESEKLLILKEKAHNFAVNLVVKNAKYKVEHFSYKDWQSIVMNSISKWVESFSVFHVLNALITLKILYSLESSKGLFQFDMSVAQRYLNENPTIQRSLLEKEQSTPLLLNNVNSRKKPPKDNRNYYLDERHQIHQHVNERYEIQAPPNQNYRSEDFGHGRVFESRHHREEVYFQRDPLAPSFHESRDYHHRLPPRKIPIQHTFGHPPRDIHGQHNDYSHYPDDGYGSPQPGQEYQEFLTPTQIRPRPLHYERNANHHHLERNDQFVEFDKRGERNPIDQHGYTFRNHDEYSRDLRIHEYGQPHDQYGQPHEQYGFDRAYSNPMDHRGRPEFFETSRHPIDPSRNRNYGDVDHRNREFINPNSNFAQPISAEFNTFNNQYTNFPHYENPIPPMIRKRPAEDNFFGNNKNKNQKKTFISDANFSFNEKVQRKHRNLGPGESSTTTWVVRLAEFLADHYPEEKEPIYTVFRDDDGVIPDLLKLSMINGKGFRCRLLSLGTIFETSRNYESEDMAKEDTARLANKYMTAYWEAARDTTMLGDSGQLSGFLDGSNSTGKKNIKKTKKAMPPLQTGSQSISIQKQQNFIEIIEEYFRTMGVAYEFTFRVEGIRHICTLIVGHEEFQSQPVQRKIDAKIIAAKHACRKFELLKTFSSERKK